MHADFKLKAGDLLPALPATLLNPDGTPFNLVGCSVVFRMRKHGATSYAVEAAAELVDEDTGRVRYNWLAGDTDAAGFYRAEFTATTADNKPITFPNSGHFTVSIDEHA